MHDKKPEHVAKSKNSLKTKYNAAKNEILYFKKKIVLLLWATICTVFSAILKFNMQVYAKFYNYAELCSQPIKITVGKLDGTQRHQYGMLTG